MESVNLFIRNNVKKLDRSNVYVAPNIPEKKLNNAITAFKCEDFQDSIIAILDSTLFGSAKEGLVFTGEKFIHHVYGEIKYGNIAKIEHIRNVTVNEKGKEIVDEFVKLNTNDNELIFEYSTEVGDFKEFTSFIQEITNNFKEYKEEKQLVPIEELDEETKKAYLKIIVNMTYIDDENIDEKEFAEILLLITRLGLSSESRFEIRNYITEINKDSEMAIKDLVEIIKSNSEASYYKSLIVSLVKDIINVYFSSKKEITRKIKFIEENNYLFNLSEEEIDLAFTAVENDHKILEDNLDDNEIKKYMKELSIKATAVGLPLAAVYLSGSVVGLSAAGITSGLATLGLGMGMTGGIVVVGAIGVLSYKGLKHLTGANELDKFKTREVMLQNIIQLNQKTISLIIGDINHVIEKLNYAILNDAENKDKIKKLVLQVAKFQYAMKAVDNKKDSCQKEANKLQCPKILDIKRLQSLTGEPTKKRVYEFIISNYEEKTIETQEGNKLQVVIKDNIDAEILEKMAKAFNVLGYFEVTNILTNKVGEGLSNIKKNIFG